MDDLISRQAAIEIVDFECGEWRGLAKTIIKKIKDMPSVTPKAELRWIPVTERLPKDGRYLCTYENEEGICVDFGRVINGAWYVMPIAWMPLPECYKGEGEA